jgi:hypothetical protein
MTGSGKPDYNIFIIQGIRDGGGPQAVSMDFLNENERCPECGQFPPDHDVICPHNPELNVADPAAVLADLEAKLKELECSDCPDFNAIAEIVSQIESVKSHVRPLES